MITITWYGVFEKPNKTSFTITKKFKGADYDGILKVISSYISFQNDCNGNILKENGIKEITHAISAEPNEEMG